MNNITILNKKEIFLFVLYGIVGCSGFARTILQHMLGTLYLPEILMVPLLYLLRKQFAHFKINYFSILIALLLWGGLLVLGLLSSEPGSLFSTSRAFLYLFILYIIFKDRNNYIDSNVIMYICFGSLIGWMLSVFYNFLHPEIYLNSRGEGYSYGNLMAIPLFLYTAYNKPKKTIFIIGLFVLIFLFFTSGLRRMMVVTIISLFLVIFLQSKISTKRILQTFFILSFFAILISLNFKQIGQMVYDVSPATYYRVFERYEESFDGTSVSDDERTGNFEKFSTWQFEHILPSGFLKTYANGNFGIYNDFPLFMLCYTFGMIIMYIILIKLTLEWLRNLFKYLKNRSIYIGCFLISGIIVFLLLFLEGAFLSDPVQIQLTALSIGSISRISKYY